MYTRTARNHSACTGKLVNISFLDHTTSTTFATASDIKDITVTKVKHHLPVPWLSLASEILNTHTHTQI